MKLIELSCDQPSFKALRFNPEGLTLIVGDASKGGDEGSSNGVGKTLSLGLVHHCLGSKINPKLKKAASDWLFTLRFSIKQKEHSITRSGDGTILVLDEKSVKDIELRSWLNASGVFRLDPQVPGLSFRSLLSRFARYAKEDCFDPIIIKKEQEADGKLRSLYLLGLDCSLAAAKQKNRNDLLEIKRIKSTWNDDHILKDIFRAGSRPRVRFEWLEQEIPKLLKNLNSFQVAENYSLLEWQENELTKELRQIEKQIAILDFQLGGIKKALEEQPDITYADLKSFYVGLENIFKPDALEHFDNVEKFHTTLSINRKIRLENDRLEILSKKESFERQHQKKLLERDNYTKNLQGKKALDEYAALARHIATLEEERNRIKTYLELEATLEQKAQEIREKGVADDRKASEYLLVNPLDSLSKYFVALAGMLYPNDPAGLVIENNTGDNQIRYNITVQIEGDDADGINAARIICFDWLIFMHGSNHNMNFLWHDNRLFAHMDPHPRSVWFSYVMKTLLQTQKQYIASINTENLSSMEKCLEKENWDMLTESIQLTLHGDKPENKLLGIQFGSLK
jgi:uncharacterized protein YydD (DUF2326 family)